MKSPFAFTEEAREASISSLFEVLVITILSLVPLVLIAYYQYVTQAPSPASLHLAFWDFVYRDTAAGQLALYAITNWAAVAWICGLENRVHIPLRPLFIVFCVIGFAYCGVLVAITAAKSYVPSSAVTIPSMLTYIVSIFCYFLLLVFEKLRPISVEGVNLSETSELHRKVNEIIGGQHG